MDDIADYKTYNSRLAKALYDKAFFIDKLDTDDPVVIDYGCADAALGPFIKNILPELHYFGYDIDRGMALRAVKNLVSHGDNTWWGMYVEWSDLVNVGLKLVDSKRERVVVANSILHEVYAYGADHTLFWEQLFGSGFDVIAIRDMVLPSGHVAVSGSRWTYLDGYTHSDATVEKMVRARSTPYHLHQFEEKWGSIMYEKNLIHWLMKYTYVENWKRELDEQYFPLNMDGFNGATNTMCSLFDYHLDHFEHYTLPFQRRQFKRDFGIDFNTLTHVKAIFRKNGR